MPFINLHNKIVLSLIQKLDNIIYIHKRRKFLMVFQKNTI